MVSDLFETLKNVGTILRVAVLGTLPTASVDYRGKLVIILGAAGAADVIYECIKGADDTYSWVDIGAITGVSADGLTSANSILLKPSGDTDDYFTFATPSGIPTIYGTGSYLRIGDAGTTAHSLASEDDLMVSGQLEVKGASYFDTSLDMTIDKKLSFGAKVLMSLNNGDTNANCLNIALGGGDTTYVPAITINDNSTGGDWGLFDGITQVLIAPFDKDAQLHTATNGVADAGAASAILKHVGGFTAAVVGDIVRITAGTLCTAGWYWITTVTSADQVTLDRDYTSGDTTNVAFVTFHNFPMIGADGVCLKCFDGAPEDANVEIDRDGWLQLDLSQANGRLYWRANNAWHYVDATA